jgi:acyl-CoA thioester hydrolase
VRACIAHILESLIECPSLGLWAPGLTVMREFIYRRRVQFYETDLAGIVHFSWYPRYMEEAEHAMWRAAGLSIKPAGMDLGFARVSVSVEFHAPLYFEEEFDVEVRIESISRRSIRYACVISRGDVRIASGTMAAVCVQSRPGEPFKAVEIPEDIRTKLEQQ